MHSCDCVGSSPWPTTSDRPTRPRRFARRRGTRSIVAATRRSSSCDMLRRQRPGRMNPSAPLGTEQLMKCAAVSSAHAATNRPRFARSWRTGERHGHAAAAALGRRPFVARPAAERRSVALPPVTVAQRALGQGRADAARRRPAGQAWPSAARPHTHGWFGRSRQQRKALAAAPSCGTSAETRAPTGRATGQHHQHVRQPDVHEQPHLEQSLPGLVEIEIVLRAHQREQLRSRSVPDRTDSAADLAFAPSGAAAAVVGRSW